MESTPKMPDADQLLLIGTIYRAHGVKGEVKIIPETDDPDRFETLERVYLGRDAASATEHPLGKVRFQPTKRGLIVLVTFDGVGSREEAEALRGTFVFAAEEDLPPLEEDEAFVHDLIGLDVETADGEAVGTVRDVMQGGGHAVYVVQRGGQPDAMIPAVEAFVEEVDLDARRLVIRPIEGLLE